MPEPTFKFKLSDEMKASLLFILDIEDKMSDLKIEKQYVQYDLLTRFRSLGLTVLGLGCAGVSRRRPRLARRSRGRSSRPARQSMQR